MTTPAIPPKKAPPPPPKPGIEHRRAPRYHVKLSAEVHLVGGRTVTMATRDVAEGGVCLQGATVFPDGAEIAFGLFLVIDGIEDATSPPVELQGKVSWSVPAEDGEPGSMGVKFENNDPVQQQRLVKYLATLPKEG